MTRRGAGAAVAGLGGWLTAQVLAFGLAGAGHGWTAPFFVSMALLPLYPLAAVRACLPQAGSGLLDGAALAAGAVLDGCLLLDMAGAEWPYVAAVFARAPVVAAAWLAAWVGWQSLLVVAMIRDRRRAR